MRMPVRWLPVVMAGSILASACGIPDDDQPTLLAQDDHRELLEGTTSTTSPEVDPADPDSIPVKLYFIGPDRKLEFVERDFPDTATTDPVLDALQGGPTAAEISQFEGGDTLLQTFIPEGLAARFGEVEQERGVQQIVVDPVAGLRERVEEDPEAGRLPVIQIVCTVLKLERPGVEGVAIYDGGEEPIRLTDIAAQPIEGAATLENFGDCMTGTEERAAEAGEETDGEGGSTSTTAG